MQFSKNVIVAIIWVTFEGFTSFDGAEAFASPSAKKLPMTTALHAEEETNNLDQASTTRRDALFGVLAAFGAAEFSRPEAASARYSSYAHREQDWQERQGEECGFVFCWMSRFRINHLCPQIFYLPFAG
jgi:hypothetical protein